MERNMIASRICQGKMLDFDLVQCEEKYVSDALATEIHHWTGKLLPFPILINAPTGSGKSSFVLKDLANYAKSYGRWILVLSNRIALNMQQKVDLCQEQGIPVFGSKSLANIQEFGNVVLCTYQSVETFIGELWGRNQRYMGANGTVPPECLPQFVVLDEAHFFCSDAVFNPRTETILESIFNAFPASIRIYMSATPEYVKPVLAMREYANVEQRSALNMDLRNLYELHKLSGKIKITEYCFKADYNHIRVNFFYEWKSIEQKILDERENSDKWLVFVNSKENGKAIRKKLTRAKADYIDAASDKAKSQLRNLTRVQFFPKKS